MLTALKRLRIVIIKLRADTNEVYNHYNACKHLDKMQCTKLQTIKNNPFSACATGQFTSVMMVGRLSKV